MIRVNGIAADGIAANDRGLHYGDGVFRTMTMRAGRLLHWPLHFEKLQADCHALGMECPGQAEFAPDIAAIAQAAPDGAVKTIVTRGPGLRGYAPPLQSSPTRIVVSTPLPATPYPSSGILMHLCALRLGHQPALAGIKHLNRLENVLARAEWNDSSIAEGLLRDIDGNAISGTMSNLFIVEHGSLVTADLARCGVAGVTRKRVLQMARREGLTCKVEPIALARVYDAEEVFLLNSVIGLWPVAQLGKKTWTPGVVTARIKSWLDQDDAAAY